MKKKYQEPWMDVEFFIDEDILCGQSGFGDNSGFEDDRDLEDDDPGDGG